MKYSIFALLFLSGCSPSSSYSKPNDEKIKEAEAVADACDGGPAICRLVCGQVYPAIITLPENGDLQRVCMIKVST